jgi:hypothetical protein
MTSFNSRSLAPIAFACALTLAGCGSDDGDRYPVQAAGQGAVSLRHEEVTPVRPPVRERIVEVPATGPTAREIELQHRIDALEKQSTTLQSEIDRLKREKAGK